MERLYDIGAVIAAYWPQIGIATISFIAMRSVIDEHNKSKNYQPLPKLPPVEPAPGVYGAARQLIQGQRAWLAETARAQITAQLDGDTMKANSTAFADWFEKHIVMPAKAMASDVIPFNDWVADYYAYCDANGVARLSDSDLYSHMDTYAKAYNCTLDQQGNYHGGHLKR